MSMISRSIVLIGMPGSGKSTTGILLAKNLGLDFIDTDIAIQTQEGKTLQKILEDSGYLTLRNIEEQVIKNTRCDNCVIATGGSAVYSKAGMTYLKNHAIVVYLSVELSALKQRIHNYDSRGIAMAPGQSFENLFNERAVLYKEYADIFINSTEHTPEQTVHAIEQVIDSHKTEC